MVIIQVDSELLQDLYEHLVSSFEVFEDLTIENFEFQFGLFETIEKAISDILVLDIYQMPL